MKKRYKCDMCGSTATDHTQIECSLNQTTKLLEKNAHHKTEFEEFELDDSAFIGTYKDGIDHTLQLIRNLAWEYNRLTKWAKEVDKRLSDLENTK